MKLVIKERVNLNFKVTLRITGNVYESRDCDMREGGESLFINLRVAGEAGVFGVDPMTLDLVDDNGTYCLNVIHIARVHGSQSVGRYEEINS